MLACYRGLNVQQLSTLRNAVREKGGRLHVVKNTLFLRAIPETKLEPLAEVLEGPTAVAFTYDDMGSVAKAMAQFSEENEALNVYAACLEGKLITPEEAARMPSRSEALSELVRCLESPIAGLVNTLQNLLSSLVWALEEVAQKKQQAA